MGVEVLLVDSSVVARTAVVPLDCLIGSSGRLISVDFEWSSLCGFDISEMALRQEVIVQVCLVCSRIIARGTVKSLLGDVIGMLLSVLRAFPGVLIESSLVLQGLEVFR